MPKINDQNQKLLQLNFCFFIDIDIKEALSKYVINVGRAIVVRIHADVFVNINKTLFGLKDQIYYAQIQTRNLRKDRRARGHE
jgi:hypothetical protein